MISLGYNLKKDSNYLQNSLLRLRPLILELSGYIEELALKQPDADKLQSCNKLIQCFLKENIYKSNIIKLKVCALDISSALKLLGYHLYETKNNPDVNKVKINKINAILQDLHKKNKTKHFH